MSPYYEIDFIECVRQRPGMFLGDTGERGLQSLTLEPIYHAIDKHRIREVTRVEVTLLRDGGCRVRDDGGGILGDFPECLSRPPLGHGWPRCWSPVPTFPPSPPLLVCGLGSLGLAAVNGLSRRLVVEVLHGGRLWRQEYARGVAIASPDKGDSSLSEGTTITFWPDPDIFQATQTFSLVALRARLAELAGLNAGLDIVLREERREPAVVSRFRYPDGLAGFFRWIPEEAPPVHPTVLHAESRSAEARAEVAFRWHHDEDEALYTFANGNPTPSGGPHVTGFRTAVTRAVRAVLRRRPEPTIRRVASVGEIFRAGLRAVIAVDLREPMFGAATRDRLVSPEAERLVYTLTRRCLEDFLREHPDEADAIVRHALTHPSTNPNRRRPR